jgi:hypothetical protein
MYFISGMNSGDFIWEFRDWEDPRKVTHENPSASGSALRFYHERTAKILTYSNANHLRELGQGYVDQFHKAFTHLVNGGEDFTFSFHEPERKDIKRNIQSAWVYRRDDRLCLMAACADVESTVELGVEVIPSLAFLLQLLSATTQISMGDLTVSVGRLYFDTKNEKRVKDLAKAEIPIVGGLNDFQYPPSNLSLRDVDNLIMIMQEYVGRLNVESVGRANPYEGDTRVLFWADMAGVFREWKAWNLERLNCKARNVFSFTHPQLQYIYQEGSV